VLLLLLLLLLTNSRWSLTFSWPFDPVHCVRKLEPLKAKIEAKFEVSHFLTPALKKNKGGVGEMSG